MATDSPIYNNDLNGLQEDEGPNESTTESKKNTNASSSGASDGKSERSSPNDKIDNDTMDIQTIDKEPLQFDYEINHLSSNEYLFNNKSDYMNTGSLF